MLVDGNNIVTAFHDAEPFYPVLKVYLGEYIGTETLEIDSLDLSPYTPE